MMFTNLPFPFTRELDPPRHGLSDQWRSHGSTIRQQMQRPGRRTIWDLHLQASAGLRGPTGATVLLRSACGRALCTEEDQRSFQWKDRPTKGTGQSNPLRAGRLSTNPVVCRSGKGNWPIS